MPSQQRDRDAESPGEPHQCHVYHGATLPEIKKVSVHKFGQVLINGATRTP